MCGNNDCTGGWTEGQMGPWMERWVEGLKEVSEGDKTHRCLLAADRKVAMMEQCYVCTILYC